MNKSGFSQAQQDSRLSQKQSDKKKTIKLVVVMNAVDWWKCSWSADWLAILQRVSRGYPREVAEKPGSHRGSSYGLHKCPQSIRNFPTRCSQDAHTQRKQHFSGDSIKANAPREYFHSIFKLHKTKERGDDMPTTLTIGVNRGPEGFNPKEISVNFIGYDKLVRLAG